MKKQIQAVRATSHSRKFSLLATCLCGCVTALSNPVHSQVAKPIAAPHKLPVTFRFTSFNISGAKQTQIYGIKTPTPQSGRITTRTSSGTDSCLPPTCA
jgi:hypothetical protein